MSCKGRSFIFLFTVFAISQSFGQFQYQYSLGIPVEVGDKLLNKAWAGGLDLAQYNPVDLNNDEFLDLMIFDRNTNRVTTFISTGSAYVYTPEYQQYFPAGLKNWVIMRDYNCDGKEDIFTSSLFGMSLYENTSSGSALSWELTFSTVFTEGSSGQVNLQINNGDFPAIEDIDNDGDLDILVFDFAVGGGVNLHKNMSVERNSVCGLDLMLTTDRYGDFEECTCEDYIFGAEVCPESGRLEHSGGKAVVSYSYSNNNIHDILIGQEDCAFYGYLPNSGTANSPKMTSVDFDFPNAQNPITLNYPVAFNLDLDFDGKKDILATNNIYKTGSSDDYAANNWFYKGDGTSYSLITRGFMQEDMLDIGSGSAPAFSDLDGDGDEDLLIGISSPNTRATLSYFKNIGDALNPHLVLISNDFLSLANKSYQSVRPQFLDLNGDGFEDLILVSTQDNFQSGQVFWHTKNPLQPYLESEVAVLKIPFSTGYDNPYFYFSGGKLIELIGRESGNLERYINQGSLENPQWEMSTNEFLGIAENFMKRNLSVCIDDLDQDGKEDLVSYDESKVLVVYSDFKGNAIRYENLLYDSSTLLAYNASFGTKAKVTTSFLTGASLPSIGLGLGSGGIQFLTNVLDDEQNVTVPIRVAVFPNPVANQQLLQVVANKDVSIKVMDTMGKYLSDNISLLKGEQLQLDLTLIRTGIYLIEAIDDLGNRSTSRFIFLN